MLFFFPPLSVYTSIILFYIPFNIPFFREFEFVTQTSHMRVSGNAWRVADGMDYKILFEHVGTWFCAGKTLVPLRVQRAEAGIL